MFQVYQCLHHNLGYKQKIIKLFDVTKFILILPLFQLIQQSLSSTRCLLNIATKETFFMFNNKYYKQVDGVAMGSPLGLALANIFMCSFESKWL